MHVFILGALVMALVHGFDPSSAHAQITKVNAKCRSGLAGAVVRLTQTALKERERCHRRRLAGLLDEGLNCNDAAMVPATTRFVRATDKVVRAAQRCGLSSIPADNGYVECPPPCDRSIQTYDDVAACLICLVETGIDTALTITYGTPAPSHLSEVQACQDSIGAGLLKYSINRFKVQSSCQRRSDRSANDVDCLVDDSTGKIALARTAMDEEVGQCSSRSLMDLNSCGLEVEDQQACTGRVAEHYADDLFSAVYRPVHAAPTPLPTVTPTPVGFTVDATLDAEDAAIDGTCDDGAGRCTLRAAITECNAMVPADPCRIGFAVGGVLTLSSHLPVITTPTWIVNGSADCGDLLASPPVQPTWPFVIDGAGLYEIIDITAAPASALRGLEARNAGVGVARVQDSKGVTIQCNYLHGAGRHDVIGNVLSLVHSPASVVGGVEAGDGNVLADAPVDLLALLESDGVTVDGNFMGMRADGETAASGEDCLYVSNSDAVVVGAQARNVLSACTHLGVDIDQGSADVEIAHNRIGTDWSGMVAVPNRDGGVKLVGTVATKLHHNQISGNAHAAIDIDAESRDTVIAHNNLGRDANGDDTDMCNTCRWNCHPYQAHDEGTNTTFVDNLVGTCGLVPGCCALDATAVEGIEAMACADDSTFGGVPTSVADCEDLADQLGAAVAVHFNPVANCSESANPSSACPPP